MDILKLIKNRKAIRKYQNKPIPKKIINKIIEAGIWGPSIHGIQPWKFVVVEKKLLIRRLSDLIVKRLKKTNIPGFILFPTIRSFSDPKLIIVVYNTKELVNFTKKVNKEYMKFSVIAELSAISATVQNMILTAESLGIASCWLDTPLFCKKEINKTLNTKDELMAVLTLGYADEGGNRSPRKPLSGSVKYIK